MIMLLIYDVCIFTILYSLQLLYGLLIVSFICYAGCCDVHSVVTMELWCVERSIFHRAFFVRWSLRFSVIKQRGANFVY